MTNLLPPNSTQLERNIAAVNARLGDVPTPLRDLVNPDTCPEKLLPWLAAELAVSPWNDQWTEMQKRGVIASAYQVHRQRGTLAALKAALSALGIAAEVEEWWQEQPRAQPGTFRVDVETYDGMTVTWLDALNSQIDAVKPLRAHYTVRLIARPVTRVYIGMAHNTLITTTIYPKAT
ncbi:phage tail protein I [Massilia dura]|uniref:Phage tail protein I n=1 Tax=Pseudoduganella dura TaxID=321982 RepID=A0A6I3XGM5_9BURK|nr:phage tail protein I [Pseudoduganella dura]MUI10905.1 phage tail protein I [Pseudoduganella dura]GGY12862.1 phage tail protein I [Pseudoduganella dura]